MQVLEYQCFGVPMLKMDSYLLDVGWLFFAAWSVVLAVVGVAVFGHDLIPFRERAESAPDIHASHADSAHRTDLG